jgi:hypothetical protein
MYGREAAEWDKLVRGGAEFLVERARMKRTTTYTELDAALVRRTGLRGFDFSQADDRAAVSCLDELWRLTSLATRQAGSCFRR